MHGIEVIAYCKNDGNGIVHAQSGILQISAENQKLSRFSLICMSFSKNVIQLGQNNIRLTTLQKTDYAKLRN